MDENLQLNNMIHNNISQHIHQSQLIHVQQKTKMKKRDVIRIMAIQFGDSI